MSKKKKKIKIIERRMTVEELCHKFKSGELRLGPIRHQTLPPALLQEIRRLWHSIGKASQGDGSLEQWEVGFMRDTNPDQEILVWQRIERATKLYLADKPDADLGDTVNAFALLSFGAEGPDLPRYQRYWDEARDSGPLSDGQHRHGTW
jgi:hypothetical protein